MSDIPSKVMKAVTGVSELVSLVGEQEEQIKKLEHTLEHRSQSIRDLTRSIQKLGFENMKLLREHLNVLEFLRRAAMDWTRVSDKDLSAIFERAKNNGVIIDFTQHGITKEFHFVEPVFPSEE